MSESESDDSDGYDLEDHEQVAFFNNEHPTYVVVSHGRSGFDKVTRPTRRAAEEAAEVHKRATGNSTSIETVFE